MGILETIRLAFSAILANRLRSFLTVLGIVIGVMSVILLISLVSGLKRFITNEISSFGSNIIFVVPGTIGGGRGPGGSQVNKLTARDAVSVEKRLSGEAEVTAVTQRTAQAKYLNRVSNHVSIYGAGANYLSIVKAVEIDKGRFFTRSEVNSGSRVVAIGPTLAKNLFGEGEAVGKSIVIANSKYKVVGVLTAQGSAFGIDQDNSAILPLEATLRQFGINNVNGIYVAANSPEQIEPVKKKIKEALLQRLQEDDFTLQTQEQALSTIAQVTNVLTIALGGIAAISLLVGGIGVMNIMLVSVTERTR